MARNRMKSFLEELSELRNEKIRINRKIVRSHETQAWIDRLFAMGGLKRNDRDHADYLICILSENALRNWPSGKQKRDSAVFALLNKIYEVLASGQAKELTPIIQRLSKNDSDISEYSEKQKRGLRTKSKRYYQYASKHRLDLPPDDAIKLKTVLAGLRKTMKTRPSKRRSKASPRLVAAPFKPR
jgi:hypothetical protein